MNVLVVGGLNLDQSLWASYEGFRKIGCAVRHVPEHTIVNHVKIMRPDLEANIARAVCEARPDLLFWWGPKADYIADILSRVDPSIPRAGFSIDDPFYLEHPNCAVDSLKALRFMVTCCAGSLGWYKERGIHAMVGYTPCDAQRQGEAQWAAEHAADFCMTGTNVYPLKNYPKCYVDRTDLVRAAAKVGKVHVYGPTHGHRFSWCTSHGLTAEDQANPNIHLVGPVSHVDVARAFASARFTINTTVRPDGHAYINRRVVEAMAAGSCVLTDRVVGMDTVLRDEIDVVMWGDLQEFEEKARYYFEHETLRRRIAEQGRETALAKFSNTVLAQRILDEVAHGNA